jgi:hypothetical protein
VQVVLARWNERRALLASLRSGRDAESAAFVRLTRRASLLLRYLRAYDEESPELRLLRRLRRERPELLRELDPAHVAWWEGLAARPRFTRVLGSSAVLALLIGGPLGAAVTFAFVVSADSLLDALGKLRDGLVLTGVLVFVTGMPLALLAAAKPHLPVRTVVPAQPDRPKRPAGPAWRRWLTALLIVIFVLLLAWATGRAAPA